MSTHVIPRSRTVHNESHINIIECANCAIDCGIGAGFEKRRREDHGTFYCPNGHANVYRGDNTEGKLRKELDRTKKHLEWSRESVQSERERAQRAERQRAAARGQVTKIKKRVAAGVCPCCNRTFQNVARHIAGQHPNYFEGTKP